MTEKADTRSNQLKDRKPALLRYGQALATFAVIIGISAFLSHFDFKINLAISVIVGPAAAGWYGGSEPGILLAGLVVAVTAYKVIQFHRIPRLRKLRPIASVCFHG